MKASLLHAYCMEDKRVAFCLLIQALLTVVCQGPLVLQDSALVDQPLFVHRNTH